MQKWAVTIYPHDYSVGSIHKVKDRDECDGLFRFKDSSGPLDFPTTVTLSGVMVVEVEAENEVEAGHVAVKQVLIKRVKDLEESLGYAREGNKKKEDQRATSMTRLVTDVDSFMDIIRGGELEIYDTGRRIFATWYHREQKRELRTELPSGILFDQLVNTIKDSVNLPEEDCY